MNLQFYSIIILVFSTSLFRPWLWIFSPMNCVIIGSFMTSCQIRSFDRNFAEIPCEVPTRFMLTAKQWICLGKTLMFWMQNRIIQYIATDVIPIRQWYKVGCEKRLCSVLIFLPDIFSLYVDNHIYLHTSQIIEIIQALFSLSVAYVVHFNNRSD